MSTWLEKEEYMDRARRIHDQRLGRVHGWSRTSTWLEKEEYIDGSRRIHD